MPYIGKTPVTSTVINDSTITTAKLANSSVTAAKIADGTVVAAEIASDAITTVKILDDNVTAAKMADNSIDSDAYVDGSIDNEHLADDAVGVAELSATGTASSSTFLRGDNAWAAAGGGKVVKVTTALGGSNTSNSTSTQASHVSQAHTMESSSNGLIVMGIGDVTRGSGGGGIQAQVYDGASEKAVSRIHTVADNDSTPIPSFYDGGYSGAKTWHVYVTSTTNNSKATINAGHGIVFIEVDTS